MLFVTIAHEVTITYSKLVSFIDCKVRMGQDQLWVRAIKEATARLHNENEGLRTQSYVVISDHLLTLSEPELHSITSNGFLEICRS